VPFFVPVIPPFIFFGRVLVAPAQI
jgi:hypothetical protein